jgi:hypothetical protein
MRGGIWDGSMVVVVVDFLQGFAKRLHRRRERTGLVARVGRAMPPTLIFLNTWGMEAWPRLSLASKYAPLNQERPTKPFKKGAYT